jgi:hypothetical protein
MPRDSSRGGMARRALRSFSKGGLKGYGEFRHPLQGALRLAAGRLRCVAPHLSLSRYKHNKWASPKAGVFLDPAE